MQAHFVQFQNDSTLTGQRYDLGKTNFAQSLLFGRELSAFHLNFRLVTLLLMGSAKIHFFLFLFLLTTPILETSDGMLQSLRCEFAFISMNHTFTHTARTNEHAFLHAIAIAIRGHPYIMSSSEGVMEKLMKWGKFYCISVLNDVKGGQWIETFWWLHLWIAPKHAPELYFFFPFRRSCNVASPHRYSYAAITIWKPLWISHRGRTL